MHPYKFSQLSKRAQAHCLQMQKKYNFKGLSDDQIKEKIKDWLFDANGDFYNPLTA